MRNFKKFLALVLAMLMVSACAISASAAFADQNQINATGYAEAVEALTSWGIINGITEGDETVFNPGGYLTRDQAAKIGALLVLGKKANDFDFDSYKGAGYFTDVVGTWSEGYVNYAAKQGYINGIGNNLYAPGDKFTFAQAAKVLTYMMGLEYDVAKADQLVKPSQWYTNIMTIADQYDVLDDIDWIGLEEAPITRAAFAQMAYNAVKADMAKSYIGYNKLYKNLGIKSATGKITAVAGGLITVDGCADKFNEAAFNAVVADLGLTAAKLYGAVVTITYSEDRYYIYNVAVSSDTVVCTSSDAFLAAVAGTDNEKKVTLNGVTYELVASKDPAADVAGLNGVGGITAVAKKVVVSVDGTVIAKNNELPKNYSGIAYDDNGDGIFDRVELKSYEAGIITRNKSNGKVGVDYITTLAGVAVDDNNAAATKAEELEKWNYTGAEFTSGTPVLYNITKNALAANTYDVDVLAVAELKTDVVSSFRDETAPVGVDTIVFGSTKLKCAGDIAMPGVWVIGQTVSMYVLDGMYAGVIDAIATDIMVDNAVVSGTNAILTGYNAKTFAPLTVTVNGIINNSKLYDATAFQARGVEKAKDSKTYFNGLVGFGTKTTEATYDYLDVDGSTKWNKQVIFEEGKVYSLTTTTDGTYVALDAGKDFVTYTKAAADGKLPKDCKLNVTATYIYNDKTPYFYNDNTVVMGINHLAKVDGSGNLADDYYAQTYLYATTYQMDKVEALVLAGSKASSLKFIWLKNIGIDTTVDTVKALDAGKTFVQILDGTPVGVELNLNIFKALDLMTGKAIEVKSDKASLTAGDLYEYDGATLSATKWFQISAIEVAENGLEKTIKVKFTTLQKKAGDKEYTLVTAADAVAIDASKITVYTLDGATVKYDTEKKVYVTEDVNKLASGIFNAYVVDGKVIALH